MTNTETSPSGTTTAIRPYRIDIAQVDVDDLRDRLARTRWGCPYLYERFNDPAMRVPRAPSRVPTAVAVFSTDVAVRPFAAKAVRVVRWSEFTRGGHFAALEAPDLLIADVREFFRGLPT
jgi:pimeloyl-ACP methyl ester carboxylesterase